MGVLVRALLLGFLFAVPAQAEISLWSTNAATDTVDRISYSVASGTVPPRAIIIFRASTVVASGTTAQTPTASGQSLSWNLLYTIPFNSVASPVARLTAWWAVNNTGNTLTTGNLTAAYASETQTSAALDCYILLGADDLAGSPVINSQSATSDSNTTLSVTLSALADAENLTFLTMASSTGTMTVESGWTKSGNFGAWKRDGETTPSFTNTSAALAMIAFEVKDAKKPVPWNPGGVAWSITGTDGTSRATSAMNNVFVGEQLWVLGAAEVASGTTSVTPTCTCTNGTTMTLRAHLTFDSVASPTGSLVVFEGTAAAATEGCTITWTAETQTALGAAGIQMLGARTSGSYVKHSTDVTDAGDNSTSATLTTVGSRSATLVVAATSSGPQTSGAVSDWWELSDSNSGFVSVVYSASAKGEVSWTNTWSGSSTNAGIIIEIASNDALPGGGSLLLIGGE